MCFVAPFGILLVQAVVLEPQCADRMRDVLYGTRVTSAALIDGT